MMSFGDPATVPWYLSQEAAEPIVRRAVEGGVTLFDTADMYSDGACEELTGRLLGKFFARRSDYVLATKVFYPTGPGPNDRGLSRAHIMDAVDASLRRLGTDYIDLYQVHRWDPQTPVEETMTALNDLVRSGKVRYVGASLMWTWRFAVAQFTARDAGQTEFVSMQTRYNLSDREDEREMLPFCAAQGVGVLPYSPLARGLLAGTRGPDGSGGTVRARTDDTTAGRPPGNDAEILAALRAVAAEHGVPPARIAMAWLLGRPGVTAPIIGTTRVEHLDDALAAVRLRLGAAETQRLEAPYRPRPPYGLD
ncbi:aldo/keto reductase [Dactylosporangium sp. CA-139066]|uniref:aldo/keto reductase n=1 Tax=Dactylosporangium sp. CA-139066 TaxID=3239930 RepID=UPI003D8B4EDA